MLERNAAFMADYEKMKAVRLNPARHAAANGYEHSEGVRTRVLELADLNECTADERALLEDLARVHDIGKIRGNASPSESVALLANYGITDDLFVELVACHDTSLPWYKSMLRGEAPSDAAWRRLASRLDLRLLCMFMVADRSDALGGWRRNAPTVWFIDEARRRGLLGRHVLELDEGPVPPGEPAFPMEQSAGCVLVAEREEGRSALLIRVRQREFEIPKGHIETGESVEVAALRELTEETGIQSECFLTGSLGALHYVFESENGRIHKRVAYFVAECVGSTSFGSRPDRTRELHWVTEEDLVTTPLVNEELRDIILGAIRV